MIKKTEHNFFNLKIQEISKKVQALETHELGQKCKLLAINAIQYNSCLCIKLEDL